MCFFFVSVYEMLQFSTLRVVSKMDLVVGPIMRGQNYKCTKLFGFLYKLEKPKKIKKNWNFYAKPIFDKM